jgi:hypothetical protein
MVSVHVRLLPALKDYPRQAGLGKPASTGRRHNGAPFSMIGFDQVFAS